MIYNFIFIWTDISASSLLVRNPVHSNFQLWRNWGREGWFMYKRNGVSQIVYQRWDTNYEGWVASTSVKQSNSVGAVILLLLSPIISRNSSSSSLSFTAKTHLHLSKITVNVQLQIVGIRFALRAAVCSWNYKFTVSNKYLLVKLPHTSYARK